MKPIAILNRAILVQGSFEIAVEQLEAEGCVVIQIDDARAPSLQFPYVPSQPFVSGLALSGDLSVVDEAGELLSSHSHTTISSAPVSPKNLISDE